MQALATADAETKQPSDGELQAMLDRDLAHYATDVVTSFDQVSLGPDTAATRAAAAGAVERHPAARGPRSQAR